MTLILFLGSVFSPRYYRLRRRAPPALPTEVPAVNLALYGRPRAWAFTEHPARTVRIEPERLAIGATHADWRGDRLEVEVDERCTPLPGRLRGRIRIRPRVRTDLTARLDAAGRHLWEPLAPRADVEVEMQSPALEWRGSGYLDHNRGSEPMEAAFRAWSWARGHWEHGAHAGDAALLYEVEPHAGPSRRLALRVSQDGGIHALHTAAMQPLPRTPWGIPRELRSDRAPRVLRTLEDSPFYARSLLAGSLDGEPIELMHETLSLARFRLPLVRLMLPVRIRRAR